MKPLEKRSVKASGEMGITEMNEHYKKLGVPLEKPSGKIMALSREELKLLFLALDYSEEMAEHIVSDLYPQWVVIDADGFERLKKGERC